MVCVIQGSECDATYDVFTDLRFLKIVIVQKYTESKRLRRQGIRTTSESRRQYPYEATRKWGFRRLKLIAGDIKVCFGSVLLFHIGYRKKM